MFKSNQKFVEKRQLNVNSILSIRILILQVVKHRGQKNAFALDHLLLNLRHITCS